MAGSNFVRYAYSGHKGVNIRFGSISYSYLCCTFCVTIFSDATAS